MDALSWVMRSLIYVLVYCHKELTFIKSVDASAMVTDTQLLCDLFFEIVDFQNAVHLVTYNVKLLGDY